MAATYEAEHRAHGKSSYNGHQHPTSSSQNGMMSGMNMDGALDSIQGLEEALPAWELGITVYVEVTQHSNR